MAAMTGVVRVAVILLLCAAAGGHALDLLRVTATSGNPPSTPKVHCWCASYPDLTLCSWSEPTVEPPTHYITTYRERHKPSVIKQCQLIAPGSSSSALNSTLLSSSSEQLWHCLLPDLKLLTDYIINITAVYPAASSSHLSSFMMEDIVKPDPPSDVRVSPLNGKNLLVRWSPPPTWANLDIAPLKYQIMYQWENRGTPKSVSLGPFENTSVELKGLTPGRLYSFQVCAKELLGLGVCSDWSSPVNITIPAARL